jgi:FMN reductase
MSTSGSPLIVGIGGTTRPGSSSEQALKISLMAAEREGARTVAFTSASLMLPLYDPTQAARSPEATFLVDQIRVCDGVIISSPGYHGIVSGLIKNALDYIEDLRDDTRPYLHNRAMGCIVCAYGWQAIGSTLASLRAVAHALRAWPTPFGAGINSTNKLFDSNGACLDPVVESQLQLVGKQVCELARMHKADEPGSPAAEPAKASAPAVTLPVGAAI